MFQESKIFVCDSQQNMGQDPGDPASGQAFVLEKIGKGLVTYILISVLQNTVLKVIGTVGKGGQFFFFEKFCMKQDIHIRWKQQ